MRLAKPAMGLAAALFISATDAGAEERLRPGFPVDAVTLLDEAQRVMNASPKDALDLTGQVLAHPDDSFSAEFLARLHYVRARSMTHAGDHREAISESEVALELLNGSAPDLRADILTTMAISLGRSRETRRAYEVQQEALLIRRLRQDAAGEATSLGAIAELYFDIGLLEKGVSTFNDAVSRARAASDATVLAVTLNNFGYFLQRSGEYGRAAPLLDEGLLLIDRVSPRLAAYILLNAASARYHTGRPAEARELVRRGLPMAAQLGQATLLLSANLTLARLASDDGALSDARNYAELALGYARDLENDGQIGETAKLLADITERQADHAAAYNYLTEHAARLAADAASASKRSAALFEAETLLAAREQEMELLRRDAQITRLAMARATIFRNAALLSALFLGAGVISLFLLLREKARTKKNIELKNRELVSAYERLEAADRNKSNFLAVMSHELKTPLNSIIGFSDILSKSEAGAPSSTVEFARIINAQGRHLLRMVSEILLFTGAPESKLSLSESVERLADILVLSVDIAGQIRTDAGERIEIAPSGSEALVACDPQQLANCVARILDNALKFSPARSRVVLSGREVAGGQVEIAVSDNGPGVSAQDIPRLFEVLGQGDQSRTRRQQGAGLGLPVAGRIAEAHGGRILVDARPSGGTTVRILLPASQPAANAEAA